MALEIRYRHEADHVVVSFRGGGAVDDFLAALREIGADSTVWPDARVLFDLRAADTPARFTEQLRIGEAVGRHFGHLRRVAVLAPAERITHVSEKAANLSGATAAVFAAEDQALQWLRSGGPRSSGTPQA